MHLIQNNEILQARHISSNGLILSIRQIVHIYIRYKLFDSHLSLFSLLKIETGFESC